MATKDLDFTLEPTDNTIFRPSSRQEVIKVALLGVAVGLLIPFIGFLIERFFILPVFCSSPDSFGVCASGGLTAYYVSTVIVTLAAVVALARWQVFRPLLIAIAAGAALWGLKKYIGDLSIVSGVEYYIFSALLFGVAYLLFYWIMRLRLFVMSVVLAVVLVTVLRFVLIA